MPRQILVNNVSSTYDVLKLERIVLRLFNIRNIDQRTPVIIYLGSFNHGGWDTYEHFQDIFSDIALVERVGINPEHLSDMIPQPNSEPLRKNRSFLKVLRATGDDKCYDIASMHCVKLINLVDSAVSEFYDKDLFSSADKGKWTMEFNDLSGLILGDIRKRLSSECRIAT